MFDEDIYPLTIQFYLNPDNSVSRSKTARSLSVCTIDKQMEKFVRKVYVLFGEKLGFNKKDRKRGPFYYFGPFDNEVPVLDQGFGEMLAFFESMPEDLKKRLDFRLFMKHSPRFTFTNENDAKDFIAFIS